MRDPRDWARRHYYHAGPGYSRYGSEYDYRAHHGGRHWKGYDQGFFRPQQPDYGRDYWWLGEHALGRSRNSGNYDRSYQRFSEEHHPRFSPVGGMYPAVGGRFMRGELPRPLRDSTWFSDWTRWF
jgi:hypothetical protein